MSRNKKKPIVIVTGCVAQAEGEVLLERDKYIDAVVGPQSYHKINKIIRDPKNKNLTTYANRIAIIEPLSTSPLVIPK